MARITSWIAALAMSLSVGITVQAAVPAPVGSQGVALHVINVDQGAAALFETPCGTLLIDAGGRTDADTNHLLDYLQSYFAARQSLGGRFAGVYLTHPHIDHDLSMLKVDAVYDFGVFVDDGRIAGDGSKAIAKKLASTYTGDRVRHVNEVTFSRLTAAQRKKGFTDKGIDPLVCEGIKPKVTALSGGRDPQAGWSKDANGNPNNHSLVLRIDYGVTSFLFLGDLQVEGQRDLVARYGDTPLLDVDVLFLPHHGAENGATPQLLNATTPKAVVISAGDPLVEEDWTAWDHGHPRVAVLDRLQAAVNTSRPSVGKLGFTAQNTKPVSYTVTKAIYSTGWDGDIVVHADGAGALTVSTEK